MNPSHFLAELKRRNVYKVAVAYAIAGWALAQGIAQVFPVFGVPNWIVQLIVLLIFIGFPIALVLAWAFELTGEGLKRTEDADLARPPRKISRLDLRRRYRRCFVDRIIFSRSLLGCPYATRSCRYFDKIDRGSAV